MDRGFRLNAGELLQAVESTEALSIFFPHLGQALVVDFRHTAEDPPLVRLTPMVRTPEERIRYLRRVRPRFPRPARFLLVPWPTFVGGLVRLGVYTALARRLAETGHARAVRALERAFEALRRLEQEERVRVVRGENYHTLWARPETP